MAERGRFAQGNRSTGQSILQLRAAAPVNTASTTSTEPVSKRTRLTARGSEVSRLAEEYDLPTSTFQLLYNPDSMNEGNKYAAAGGSDMRTAKITWALRNSNQRPPSAFEVQFPAFYNPDREPIVGQGGKTLDPNDGSYDSVYEHLRNGFIPQEGTAAYKTLKSDATASGFGSVDQYVSEFIGTDGLGRKPVSYGQYSGLQQYTARDKARMPDVGSVVYGGPEVGWTVAAGQATSPNNFPALQGNMTPDDPNFQPTPNPNYWVLPNGAKVKSVPGSGTTVGFNNETWSWMTRPSEVGAKTTWELAATNPSTGKIDPGMISRETAAALQQYGNLPKEFEYLLTEGKSWGDWETNLTFGGGRNTGTGTGTGTGGNNNGGTLPKFKPTPVGKTPTKFLSGGGASGRAGISTTPGKGPTPTPTMSVPGSGTTGRSENTTTGGNGTVVMPPPRTPTTPSGPTTNAGVATPPPVKTLDQILAQQNEAIIAAQKAGTMTGGMPNLKVKTGGR